MRFGKGVREGMRMKIVTARNLKVRAVCRRRSSSRGPHLSEGDADPDQEGDVADVVAAVSVGNDYIEDAVFPYSDRADDGDNR